MSVFDLSALELLSFLMTVVAIAAVFFAFKWQQSSSALIELEHQQKLAQNRVISTKRATDPELQDLYTAKAQEARDLHNTFRRFVPTQFIQHLQAKDERHLQLGVADETELAVMFVDIVKFSRLAETLSPQQTLNFLNAFLLRMNAPIHANNGFIDKFNGDAIMALFDHPEGAAEDKVMDAVQAAMGLRDALTLYNEHRANSGYDPVDIGIGVHFGPVIIGTIGSEDRMDTTALGDNVNIAYRVEALCRDYNAQIIITEQVVLNLPAGHRMTFRLLDNVIVKGRTQGQKVYELLTHLPKQQQIIKLSQEKDILECLRLRKQQQYTEMSVFALQCLSKFPSEAVFARFLAQSEILSKHPQKMNKSGAVQSVLES